MKSFLFRLIAGNTIRLGIRYTYEAVNATIAALRGVLEYGKVSDDVRSKVSVVIDALSAVSDFLAKVVLLVGAPSIPTTSSAGIESYSEKLRRITDSL